MRYENNISPEELERIERFLTGNMTLAESTAFEQELTSNEDLHSKTGEIQILLLGIKETSLEQKLNRFHARMIPSAAAQSQARPVPMVRRLLVAASVIAFAGLLLWGILSTGGSDAKTYSNYYKPDAGLATVMSSGADYDFEKAMVEYKNGEYDKALASWNAQHVQQPANDTLVYFIAAAYQAKGEIDSAITHLRQVVGNSNHPFYKDACWYLGLAYIKKGDNKQAADYITRSAYPQAEALLKEISE